MSKKTCFFHENHRFRLFYGCFEADRPRNNAISLRKQRTLHTVDAVALLACVEKSATLIDLLIVTMFTHPLVQLLARNKFFASGHRFSGFDLSAKQASYKGRGEFRVSKTLASGKAEKSSKEAQKRQTIAERKALAAKGDSDE